jgi:hypothetical protein
MKVANAIAVLQKLDPEEEILFDFVAKRHADENDWGCALTQDGEYIELPKEVWNDVVETVTNKIQWEQLADTLFEFVHDEFVTIANEQKEIDKQELQLWEA